MKKITCLILALLVSMMSLSVFAEDAATDAQAVPEANAPTIEISEVPTENDEPLYLLVVNGIGYSLTHPLYMENGRTMVEAQTLSELIGVEMSNADGFVTFTDGENVAKLSLTSDGATLNDGAVVLDAYAKVKDEVTFVPLRFVAESFGCTVGFSPVFTEENLFLGAYITVDTPVSTNVDFKLIMPENSSELTKSIVNITKTITGVIPEISLVNADEYTARINAALLAGEKIMFIKNGETAKIDGHIAEDLLLSFDEYLKNADENSKIFAFPVELSGEALEFCVSKSVEKKDEAVYFLIGMNELIASLTGPQE